MYPYVVWTAALAIFGAAVVKVFFRRERPSAVLAPPLEVSAPARPEPPLRETVDLNAVVEEAQGLLERVARKEIEWVTRLDPRAPRLETGSSQIHQALVNLLLNACAAMPEGGVLTIETVSVCIGENPPAARRKAVAGHYALLAVSDTGAAIQNDSNDLALTIVRHIVTESGGWMQLHSGQGKGSRSEIYLPQIT